MNITLTNSLNSEETKMVIYSNVEEAAEVLRREGYHQEDKGAHDFWIRLDGHGAAIGSHILHNVFLGIIIQRFAPDADPQENPGNTPGYTFAQWWLERVEAAKQRETPLA